MELYSKKYFIVVFGIAAVLLLLKYETNIDVDAWLQKSDIIFEFIKNTSLLLLLIIGILLTLYKIFPTKKTCPKCKEKLLILAGSKHHHLGSNMLEKGNKDFIKSTFICEQCETIYSSKLKKLGLLKHIKTN